MITAVSPLELLHAFFACLRPFKGRNKQEAILHSCIEGRY